jgi:hypothetical protein
MTARRNRVVLHNDLLAFSAESAAPSAPGDGIRPGDGLHHQDQERICLLVCRHH